MLNVQLFKLNFMKQLLFRSLYFFSLILLFTSCEEQEVTFLPSGNAAFPSGQRVEASFYGRLLDQQLVPVMEAQVWIGDRMTLTDSLGDWTIPKVEVTGRQAYIKVEAEGYFAASRVLSVLPNSLNLVRILATRQDRYESIQSSAGGEVQLPDGSSLTFQPGSFVDEATGATYDGEVWVFAHAIDGRDEVSQLVMPGRLESTTENEALISFGMIATDLESPSGEPLQLREGMPATIRYEQANPDVNAPDTIPLWHFDEGIGTWVKEGFSVREGNAYVGEVSHFTWWNCDWPENLVDFCIQFECLDSIPSLVNRSDEEGSYCLMALIELPFGFGRTMMVGLDKNLKYCDVLPANSEVTFSFLQSSGSEIEFGPFNTGSEEIDFGVHEVDCSSLERLCTYRMPGTPGQRTPPNRPPNRPPPPPQVPSPPIQCQIFWNNSDCENAQQDFWIRVVSNEFNSTPSIFRSANASSGSVTLSVPSGRRIIVSMIDPSTGEVIGKKQFMPRPQIDVGTLNPGSGVIGARPINVTGRLFDCAGVAGDVYVKLTNTEGEVVSESTSGPDGRFTLITNECDASLTTLTIAFSEGERTFAAELYDDRDFGDIRQCAADGNYYWRVKLNSEIFDYSICSGRAGANGWVAYASAVPDADAPLFGLLHNNKINNTGPYRVGPDEDVYFNVFRHDNHNMTGTTHPFSGILRVTEYGQVAAGVFTGSCIDGNGDTVTIEMEMRFEKP